MLEEELMHANFMAELADAIDAGRDYRVHWYYADFIGGNPVWFVECEDHLLKRLMHWLQNQAKRDGPGALVNRDRVAAVARSAMSL